MSFETRVREELNREGSRLTPHAGDINAVIRRGRRRRLTSLAGAAMLVVLLAVGFGVLLQFVQPSSGPVATVDTDPPPTPAPPASTTVPAQPRVLELVVAGAEGITLIGEGGVQNVFEQAARLALDDLSGGIVFEYAAESAGPAIFRLPSSEIESQLLVATELVDEVLTLHDVVEIGGSPTVVYTRRSGTTPEDTVEELVLHDLVTNGSRAVALVGGYESGPTRVSYADGRFLLSMSAEGFTWFEFLAEDGSPVEVAGNPRTEEQSQQDFLTFVGHGVQSPDGSTMAYLRGHPRSEAPFEVVMVDLLSGEDLTVTPVEGAHETTVTRLEWNGEVAVLSFTDRSPVLLADV